MDDKVIKIVNKKSHEKLVKRPILKKSVAFFQANPWLGNSTKSREIKIN